MDSAGSCGSLRVLFRGPLPAALLVCCLFTGTLRHEVCHPWPTTWTRGGVDGDLMSVSEYDPVSLVLGDLDYD